LLVHGEKVGEKGEKRGTGGGGWGVGVAVLVFHAFKRWGKTRGKKNANRWGGRRASFPDRVRKERNEEENVVLEKIATDGVVGRECDEGVRTTGESRVEKGGGIVGTGDGKSTPLVAIILEKMGGRRG